MVQITIASPWRYGPAVLVFELNALVISANTVFVLHEDGALLARARTAVGRALAAATPA